jgi:hypothetical protein
MSAAAPERAGTDAPAMAGRWLILFGLITAAIMEVLDTTIVNVALPQMAGNLGATREEVAWVSTSYILANVVVLNTLSKRSNMTGYRSGFMAGDARLIAGMKALRPSTGVTPQEFVQRASVAAWGDEVHVQEQRRLYETRVEEAQQARVRVERDYSRPLSDRLRGVLDAL